MKRPEHVAQNTLAFNTPHIGAGKASPQTLRVHAVDGGHLKLWFSPGPQQYGWDSHGVDIRVTSVTAGESASCTHRSDSLTQGTLLVACELTPGDTDITYTLTSAPGTESWRIEAHAAYQVYSWGQDDQNRLMGCLGDLFAEAAQLIPSGGCTTRHAAEGGPPKKGGT